MSHFLGEQINLAPRMGWINRHLDGMPKETCRIKIQTTDAGKIHMPKCTWKPFCKEEWTEKRMPASGYLGTAWEKTLFSDGSGEFEIGYHAWENHNSEFVYYQIIEEKNT